MDTLKQSYSYGTSPLSPNSFSTPLRAYLFGKPISHSRSPLVQSILFKSVSASWSFQLVETTDISEFTAKLKDSDFIGASITMPNKIVFMPLLDDLTEEARVIGAVNTTFVRLDEQGTRRYIGTNTDCIALRETILMSIPGAVRMNTKSPALVIGGGGAARSAIYALWKWLDPSEIYIVNRFKTEVDSIVASFEKTMPGIKLRHVASIQIVDTLQTPSIAIGTIPDYPPVQRDEILSWEICEAFMKKKSQKGLLIDMCYHPNPRTRLCVLAEANGWFIKHGTEIVARVCAAQQVLWLESEHTHASVSQALSAMKETLTPKL